MELLTKYQGKLLINFIVLLVMTPGIFGCARVNNNPVYYMEQRCSNSKQTNILVHKAVRVEPSSVGSYPTNMECMVDFEAAPDRWLHLQLSKVNLRYSPKCTIDLLVICAVDSSGNRKDMTGPLCDSAIRRYNYGTRRMSAFFRSTGGYYSSIKGGFEIIATSYRSSSNCSSSEFKCSGTNKCIASDLVCDGVDNCFDGSDEWTSTCQRYGRCAWRCRLAIGIGTAVAIAMLVSFAVLVVCCCLGAISCTLCGIACCSKKKQQGRVHFDATRGNNRVDIVTPTGVNTIGTAPPDAPPAYPYSPHGAPPHPFGGAPTPSSNPTGGDSKVLTGTGLATGPSACTTHTPYAEKRCW